MSSGLLLLDNNCYRELVSADRLARFRANLRISDLIAQPSEVNLIESTSAPDGIREQLLRTIHVVANGQPLLPWPFKLLKQIGNAIVKGERSFRLEASGKEWLLEDPVAAGELNQEVLEFQRGIEAAFTAFHSRNHQRMRAQLRHLGGREDFGEARSFLERAWYDNEMRREYAEVTWSALDLSGDAPIAELEKNEAWRLLLDAEGLAMYERAIAHTQPKAVQRLDLIQLVYLALAQRRVLATGDIGLLRAAAAILPGRYPNARAVHIRSLFS
jgi:hypothetical protein